MPYYPGFLVTSGSILPLGVKRIPQMYYYLELPRRTSENPLYVEFVNKGKRVSKFRLQVTNVSSLWERRTCQHRDGGDL
jgi:hypothetical protein